jgi:dolichol-phosphate mannosyltransferase
VHEKTLTVLILTRNEAENLEVLLPRIIAVLAGEALRFDLLVIDADSHDGTAEVAARHGARVIAQRAPGYANALRQGLAASTGDYVLTLDADMSHQPEFILDLLGARDEADLVIASRYVPGGGAEMPRHRLWLSLALNRVYGAALGLSILDLSSGFRLYRREAIASLVPRGKHFDVMPEIVAGVIHRGGRVVEVPFHYQPREAGVSKARVLGFGPSYARTLVRCVRGRINGGRRPPRPV